MDKIVRQTSRIIPNAMALDFAVFTTFKNRDSQVNQSFKLMTKGAVTFGNKTDQAFRKASKSASMFKSVTGGILTAGALSRGLGLVGRGAGAAAIGFLDLDQNVTSAAAKFKDLKPGTKAFADSLEALKKRAREVGRDTEFSADQAAGGLDFLALAGFESAQAMALLPGVTNLATIANIDLARATDIASDSLGAFGLMTDDTTKLTENFNRVQDVMAKTTATSNTNLEQLFEAVQKGAPDFTAAGQSIETFSTLVGAMANAGIKGGEAGTKLRNMAVRLAGPTKKAAGLLRSMGIRTADSEGNFRDMLDIIDDVTKGTAKMGEVQRAAALKTIFGARQTGGLNVILKEGTERLRSYRQMLIDSTGASKKMADIMRSSLMNRLKSLGSAALEVGFQVFDAFDEKGAKAIETFTMFLRSVNLKPILTDLIAMSEKFAKIATDTEFFRQSVKTFDAFSETLTTLGKSISELAGFMPELSEQFKVIDTLLLPITKNFKALELVFKGIDIAIKGTVSGLRQLGNLGSAITGTVLTDVGRERLGLESGQPRSAASARSEIESFEQRQAPGRLGNQQQDVNFSGKLNIAGAPEGSTFEQEKGPPLIDVGFSGATQGI